MNHSDCKSYLHDVNAVTFTLKNININKSFDNAIQSLQQNMHQLSVAKNEPEYVDKSSARSFRTSKAFRR